MQGSSKTRPTARGRSTSRIGATNAPTKKSDYRSFAQIVAQGKVKPSQIRNIQFAQGQEERCQTILADTGHALGARIISSKKRGKNFITIKCATAEDAVALDKQVEDKLNGFATVEKEAEKRPQVKITNIPTGITDTNIITELIEQNAWYRAYSNIALVEIDSIQTQKRTYRNAIISCDLPQHTKFLEKGYVILDFEERLCYEHIIAVSQLPSLWP